MLTHRRADGARLFRVEIAIHGLHGWGIHVRQFWPCYIGAMTQCPLPPEASPETALVFEAARAVTTDARVLEAISAKYTTPSSVMDALLVWLRAYNPAVQATHVGVKTSRTAAKRKGEFQRRALSCVQYLHTEGWFFGLDVDSCIVRDASRPEWGFVAMKGAVAVFEYETARLGDPVVAWHHTLVDVSTVSPKCPIAAALVVSALEPMLADRASLQMSERTPLPSPAQRLPAVPRI